MLKHHAFLAIAASCIAPSGALAQDSSWYFANSDDEAGTFMDVKSAHDSPPVRRIWMAEISKKPRAGAPHIRAMKTLDEYDCKDRRHRVLVYVSYDWKNDLIRRIDVDYPSWKYSAPGTYGDNTLSVVCGQKDPIAKMVDTFDPISALGK